MRWTAVITLGQRPAQMLSKWYVTSPHEFSICATFRSYHPDTSKSTHRQRNHDIKLYLFSLQTLQIKYKDKWQSPQHQPPMTDHAARKKQASSPEDGGLHRERTEANS